ncbi:uncharacterized protein At4g38062-like [Arachis stenosperma]|uniref:uncharacterized protein At4g38062-like n=1 Tax=Arachis stenosperma TaxID=217475 RepID=UPI0025AC3586|nr:uncharacterized protein At4g38062-like [Arachis stenosperma]
MNQKAFKDLDEANVEIERLVEELTGKTDSLDNLKRSHNEKVNEIREAKLKIEEMDLEILQKESEIKDFKQDLSSKESIIKDLSAENEKLRAEFDNRRRNWEDEKRQLALELEKANVKLENQELQLNVFKQEIETLEWCLEASNKKTGGQESDDVEERFKHLQGVHEQLKGEFNSTMKGWELEKARLLYEISSLQGKLESRMKISEDLQNQLHICKQALASAEEIRRKRHNEKKQEQEQEQENPRLQTSLREIQDDQVQEAGQYSLSKLRSELKILEEIHRECVSKFKARQAEWNFQLERSTRAITNYRSQLIYKIAEVEDLKMELEGSYSFSIEMMMLNEELSVTLIVLKSGIYDAKWKPFREGHEMEVVNQSGEDKLHQLMKQFEMKNGECDRTACLTRQVDSCALPLDLQNLEPSEIDRHRDMLDLLDAWDMVINESDQTLCEITEIEYELQMWKSFAERLKTDLDENFVIRKELESSLLAQVEFSETLKQERDSLASQVEQKTRSIEYLQEHFVRLKADSIEEEDSNFEDVQNKVALMAEAKELEEQSFSSQLASEEVALMAQAKELEEENPMEDKAFEKENPIEDECSSSLTRFSSQLAHEEVALMAQAKELEREIPMDEEFSSTFTSFSIPREEVALMAQGKELEQENPMEDECSSWSTSFSLHLANEQAEIKLLREACARITAAEVLAALEVEEKKLMIAELQGYIRCIEQKLELQEENCSQTEQLALENRNLQENSTILSSEKEILLAFVLGLSGKLCDECTLIKDTKLIEMLRSIVQSFENDRKGDDALLVKENMKLHHPTGIKEPEIISNI